MTDVSFLDAASDTPLPARLQVDPRVRLVTPGEAGHRGEVVVYWAQMARRARSNAALALAIAEANARGLPLLVYEAVRVDYPFASDRFHTFLLEGARGEAARYRARGAAYAFFLPRSREEARGVVRKLAARAALLVTDEYPTFLGAPQLAGLAKAACPVLAVDDNAVVPLALFPKEEYAARTIRPKALRLLPAWFRPIEENVAEKPAPSLDLPFSPFDVEREDLAAAVARLPIDHAVRPVAELPGGSDAAHARLALFVKKKLGAYADGHNQPDARSTSGLSPYLHFGMIGAREVALAVADARGAKGPRDAFLEQLLVRRSLAFNLAARNPAHRSLDALPDWAKKTLGAHAKDPRERIYSREELEQARTGDRVWNAAQRELVQTGIIHNYLRMLWGKLVIAWKGTPAEAFDDLVYLNDKYALDGRDPNTYTNILWCFGKHDRPWGPARPIYGTVRFMSTRSALQKLKMEAYLSRWAPTR